MGSCFSSLKEPAQEHLKQGTDVSSEVSAPPCPAPTSPNHLFLVKAKGHYLYLNNGQRIIDGCGGAAVACIGHGRKDVIKTMTAQAKQFTYVSWAHFENEPAEKLSNWLISSTGGRMGKVYVMCSGKH